MRLDSDSTLNRRYERILRRLCGRAGVLPTLFYIPHEELEKTSSQAVAGGGFADVYEGRYKGERGEGTRVSLFAPHDIIIVWPALGLMSNSVARGQK